MVIGSPIETRAPSGSGRDTIRECRGKIFLSNLKPATVELNPNELLNGIRVSL